MTASIIAVLGAVVAVLGAAATIVKGRSESRHIAVQAANEALGMLRSTYTDRMNDCMKETARLEGELEIQRRRRHELEEQVAGLERAVIKLEWWIVEHGSEETRAKWKAGPL